MADIVLAVTYFAILLGLGIIVANVLRKSKLPDAFFLLLLGLLLGPTLFMNPYVAKYISLRLVEVGAMGDIPGFLRMLAIILAVFTSTFNMGFRVFKKFGSVSIKLAFLGVICNAVLMGIVAHLIFGFDWVFAFLLGAVISGTESTIVFSLEHVLKGFKRPLNILKIESVLNTPVAILLPLIFIDLVNVEPGALLDPMKYLWQFWLMIAAGVGTGVLIGIFVAKVMKDFLKEYSTLFMFSVALLTFAFAENIGGSGILAVAVCGLIAGDLTFPQKYEVKMFDDQLTELFRISVFTLLGAGIMLSMNIQEMQSVLVFFLVFLLTRPLYTIPLLGKERKNMDKHDLLLLSFVAPLGLPSAAMAPIIALAITAAGHPQIAASMVNIIFMVVLLSILSSTTFASILGRFGPKRKQCKEAEEEMKNRPINEKLLETVESSM